MLPAYAGSRDLPLSMRRHLSSCPGCRAEQARYEVLGRSLLSMTSEVADPPRGLRDVLVAIPAESSRLVAARAHVVRHKTKYAGAAVTLAGMAGAALWQSRRRAATA